jgi:hypothetical protein
VSPAVAQPEPLLTIRDASRKLGLPYGTLRRLVSLRRVRSVSVAGIPRLRMSQVLAVVVERRSAV